MRCRAACRPPRRGTDPRRLGRARPDRERRLADHRHGAWYRVLGPDNRKLSDEKSPAGTADRIRVVEDLETDCQLLQRPLQQLEVLVEERKRKAEAANRTKSAFLANTSHEIRPR